MARPHLRRPLGPHRRDPGKLGLRELVAIAVGGMIGGGIFSVLGLAAKVAGNAAPAALGVGAVVAGVAGYSYGRLAVTFPRDGASYVYLLRAFPHRHRLASLTGWTVVVGYVGTLALYAFTFGAYGADLLGYAGSTIVRVLLGIGVLVAFVLVNLVGVREAGMVEDLIVYGKLAILALFGLVGFLRVEPARMTPFLDHGLGSVFTAGALIFVAYEGFQLTTNAVQETDDPARTLPRAIYTAVGTVAAIYVLLAFVSVGTLGVDGLVAAQEYALAAVAAPLLGDAGRVLVGLAALMATSSAINSTLFGASRLAADMAAAGAMPARLGRVDPRRQVPTVAVVVLALPAMGFLLASSLDLIAAFSSMTFLLVSMAVSIANLRLLERTGSARTVVVAGLALMGATVTLLIGHLAAADRGTLLGIAAAYLVVAGLETAHRLATRRRLQIDLADGVG